MNGWARAVRLCALFAAVAPASAWAQVCSLPPSVRDRIPSDPPPASPYATLGRDGEPSFDRIALGVGHVHYSASNPVLDLPPGGDDWLRRVRLPLSRAPGEEPFAWIADGWIVTDSAAPTPLSTRGLVETGYEEPSFPVLGERRGGWLRVRYLAGPGDEGTAWTHACALEASPAKLDFTRWDEWLLRADTGPLFFRSAQASELRATPSPDSALLEHVAGDHAIVPLEIRGEWMRIELRQPSDSCVVDIEPTRQEGWIRWYAADLGPLVWYFTRGC